MRNQRAIYRRFFSFGAVVILGRRRANVRPVVLPLIAGKSTGFLKRG
jgi:hypothetical protein